MNNFSNNLILNTNYILLEQLVELRNSCRWYWFFFKFFRCEGPP